MCAPAKVMSQLFKCEHVSEKCYVSQRALAQIKMQIPGDRKGPAMNRQGSQRKCHPVMILG
eukprot:1145977-Pelagomonas_calceolata.AAC.1